MGYSLLKCFLLGNCPNAKTKVDLFLKLCVILNQPTLKVGTVNYD